MANGPSPLIPFLVLITLGIVIYRQTLLTSVSMILNLEQTIFDFVLAISLLVFLMAYFITGSITISLVLMLIVYLVSKMLLWPLILILISIILLVNNYLPPLQGLPQDQEMDGRSEERGWGFILLSFIFLVLYGLLYEGEGYDLGVALLAILFFILYNMLY